MPIKGLTDYLRMPRVGKIHLGVRSTAQSGAEYPTPTDYFVCPQAVIDAIGDPMPRELNILFPTDDPEFFADAHLKLFSRSRGLVCKGDGETANRTVNMARVLGKDGVLPDMPNTAEAWPVVDQAAKPEDIGRRQIQCRGEDCPQYGPKGCHRMMMLQFLLPDVPGLGIYQIDTGSRNSILNIYGGIELVRALVGRVAMVPLKLRIGPMETTSPETGRKQTNYVMSLHCDLTMAALSQYKALGPGNALYSRQLPDPDDEIPTDLIPESAEDPAGVVIAEVVSRKAPAPVVESPTEAPSEYGQEVWSMTASDMLAKVGQRREVYHITKESLKAKATEIGLDDPRQIKPDQFMLLMDWMAENQLQPADYPASQDAKDRLDFLIHNNHISSEMLASAMASFDIDSMDAITVSQAAHLEQWAENFSDDEHSGKEPGQSEESPKIPEVVALPAAVAPEVQPVVSVPTESDGEPTLDHLLQSIGEEYTWDSTIQLASQFGVRTRGHLETQVLKMTITDWEQLDGTPATAARRLILNQIKARDKAK